MENRTDFENNPQVDPTIVEEVLRDINTLQNEKNFEIDLEKQKNILHDKLTIEEAKILVDQQDYIDYLNPEATSFERVAAFIVDITSILIVSACLISITLLSLKASLPQLHTAIYSNRLIELILLTVAFNYIAYFTILEARRFSTLGKNFFHIRVIDETGECLSVGESFLRTILGIITLGKFQDQILDLRVIKS